MGINYEELGLYLSLNRNNEQLQQMGLDNVCPIRKSNRGPAPKITGCGTKEKKEERHKPWKFPNISNTDGNTKRNMLTEALRVVLKILLETHTYDFAGEVRRQRKGGAIGMEVTGVIAQIFMVWWDKELRRRLEAVNLQVRLYERYVDDTNMVVARTEVGTRYDGEQLITNEESVQEDLGIRDDKRTMTLIQSIAEYIHPSIKLTVDYPSNHLDNKVPMLDVKMWIADENGRKVVLYEHYEKESATKSVINAMSAIPTKTKRTVLSQEMLRILLHCSNLLPWETVCEHVNNLLKKMQYSGYNQLFRYNVTRSAMKAYNTIKKNEELGIRPMNRPKHWQ